MYELEDQIKEVEFTLKTLKTILYNLKSFKKLSNKIKKLYNDKFFKVIGIEKIFTVHDDFEDDYSILVGLEKKYVNIENEVYNYDLIKTNYGEKITDILRELNESNVDRMFYRKEEMIDNFSEIVKGYEKLIDDNIKTGDIQDLILDQHLDSPEVSVIYYFSGQCVGCDCEDCEECEEDENDIKNN
jgi:hypothetical protein